MMSVKAYLASSMPSRIFSSDSTSSMGFLSGRTGGICSNFLACSVADATACKQPHKRSDEKKAAL